ncbi:MAG: GAF domain-containing sensor histidine kinase [Anaerolineae bacterium]|nr:MAG: GAF domain-containing sensor histidine kinase [Anaerolineae bacterium]
MSEIITHSLRIQQLERLIEVSRNLSAMLELEPLLQTIVAEAADLTRSQEASILLQKEDEKTLQFVAAPWHKRDRMGELSVPMEGSIAGQVLQLGEPVLVPNVQKDPRHFADVDLYTDFKTDSILAVPMTVQGKVMGVLTAVNKQEGNQFGPNDTFILETLASQAAIAINNANLLKQSQEAYEDLSELDRMKGDFIAITSHELRTPLGLILGHATFLNEMVPDDLKNQMDVIVRSSMRLKEIVEDLSKVNNFQTGQARVRWSEVNLNQLLQEVARTFKEEATRKKLNFELRLPKDDLMVEGDSEKIGIAIIHILRNAITFTDEGSVTVSAARLPGHVQVSVTDTGIGIPEKDLARIFERFYQVESHMTRRHGGMGLGLSVAKMMVEMHNGRISVNSDEGKGSTFNVLFPITGSQTQDLKTALRESNERKRKAKS